MQVNKVIEAFYRDMYTSKITGNNSSNVSEHDQNTDDFIEELNIPKLSVEEQESLEQDLAFRLGLIIAVTRK